ncbi:MAG: IMP dehydrogenase, partial [Bacteroidota bacterium]
MTFQTDRFAEEALTYDDVLLLPGYSEVLPREVNTNAQLTREIRLNIPLLSAAMDTVTEFELAIAMAQEGGLGFIHKNMSIEQQAEQVRRVKRSESGMVLDPVTLDESATIGEATKLMLEFRIGGIPVIDKGGRLKGIVTNRDLRFEKDPKKAVRDIMTTKNLITASEGITHAQAEDLLQEFKIEKLPIVNVDYKLVGLITYKDIQKRKHRPDACKDAFGRLRVGAAVGITADLYDRTEALVKAGVDVISIDTAHAHSKGVITALKQLKQLRPDLQMIVGNIATAEGAKAVIAATMAFTSSAVSPSR